MNPYEELHKRCYEALWRDGKYSGVDAVMAEVFRTLETVTPEMVDAVVPGSVRRRTIEERAKEDWIAMLRVSPLAPPKEPGK